MDKNSIQFAAHAILAYLQQHPESADTTLGVHQWWIAWPDLPESITVTAAALSQLEGAHLIERHRAGNHEIWRLPRPPQPAD
jgi:hypothetical protein